MSKPQPSLWRCAVGTTADNEGNYLTAAKHYIMTFKVSLPYIPPGFWSLTIYDAQDN